RRGQGLDAHRLHQPRWRDGPLNRVPSPADEARALRQLSGFGSRPHRPAFDAGLAGGAGPASNAGRCGYRSLAASFRDGTWTLAEWVEGPNHGEAFGKTLALLGFGRIGREIAIRAKALGMSVTALSTWRSAPPDRTLLDRAYRGGEWRAFLEAADFLVVCCPLTAETRGLVDAAWLAAMKPSAVVINVARGPIIDEAAFHAALTERGIRGATIDVWYKYPPASGERVRASQLPFHELPNVVMTRHASGHTEETWERRFRAIAQNLEAFAQGRPLANVISEIGGRNTESR
ncbi:MAG TPA: NAD(P)-dependent oxidoreductase, partial [Xanthobacteraceae bacterium]